MATQPNPPMGGIRSVSVDQWVDCAPLAVRTLLSSGLGWVSRSMGWLHNPSGENSSILHVAKMVYIHRTMASKIQFK